MNGVLLMVVAAAVLACGYLGYGRWLANKWGVDKEALTPAKRMTCATQVSSSKEAPARISRWPATTSLPLSRTSRLPRPVA